ncbi:hypothetical protein Bbelb_191000 [Branchiostoma belcheri]|nr:hypothetical protein Bbelb_191000 [Branchiostoma belcheri]
MTKPFILSKPTGTILDYRNPEWSTGKYYREETEWIEEQIRVQEDMEVETYGPMSSPRGRKRQRAISRRSKQTSTGEHMDYPIITTQQDKGVQVSMFDDETYLGNLVRKHEAKFEEVLDKLGSLNPKDHLMEKEEVLEHQHQLWKSLYLDIIAWLGGPHRLREKANDFNNDSDDSI